MKKNKNFYELYFISFNYTTMHFSKYIRPKAQKIGLENTNTEIMATAVQNIDKSIVVVVFNPANKEKIFNLKRQDVLYTLKISRQARQTIIIKK